MTELHELAATDLVAAYRAKTLSPVAVMDDVIARVAAWEPHIKALYLYEPDKARALAKQSEARWQAGAPQGALDGVPVTIKDNIATQGQPVPLGTACLPLTPAAEDAPPAARLREAGAIIFSKTTMPDFGMLSSGLSSFHPLTRNPWDLRMNPGGSSSGAGAAAAAGYGPLHLGTDIGGSVRLPACWCGIFALKPSLGRVPIDPPYVGRCAGPMTRTVADAALMMGVLAQPDARDPMSLPPADIDWTALDASPLGKRFGLMLDLGAGLPLDPQVRTVVTAAAHAFAAAGASVVEVPSIVTDAILRGLDTFFKARSWADVAPMPPAMRDKMLPHIRTWAESGEALSGADALRGFNATMTIRTAAARLFRDIDYLISPVSPVVNFPAEHAAPNNDPQHGLDHIGYTVTWNMSEQPAAAINGGTSGDGFPIGVQIVGRRFDDLGVLQMAQAFETMRGPQKGWPEPPAS
jgi:aspartyl-tRNA(Asn)/glutamyl-tRNA(Gln) amidotransferase subunit A